MRFGPHSVWLRLLQLRATEVLRRREWSLLENALGNCLEANEAAENGHRATMATCQKDMAQMWAA